MLLDFAYKLRLDIKFVPSHRFPGPHVVLVSGNDLHIGGCISHR